MKYIAFFWTFFLIGNCSIYSLNAQKMNSSEVGIIWKDTLQEAPPPPKNQEIVRMVQEMPRFPGCEGKTSRSERQKCAEIKLIEFVYEHIKYPPVALANKVEGMCVVEFMIEKDGTMSEPRLLRDIGAGCGAESLRVVNLMIEKGIYWIPIGPSSRTARVKFMLPIKFKLD